MNRARAPHDLAELYAIGALQGDDLETFDDHLEKCARCSVQLPSLMETIAALIPDSPAPSRVWGRILGSLD
ncbi:MAG: hypothetical protein WAL25_03950 [Acidimicrobiia bacterium]